VDHVSSSARPIVVAGDWHGDLQWARQVIRAAHAAGAKTILHVGDLGVLWPGRGKGRFDAKLDRYLDAFNMDLFFADGNHDNHVELRALEVGPDGLAAVLPRIKYLPRAGRTVVQGIRIGALGGAYSVDHPWRTPGVDWWPGVEEVAPQDVEKLIAGGPVDILLAHDVPAAVELQSKWDDLDADTIAQAQVSRDLLQNAVDTLRPPNVFSGHWHIRRTEFIHHVSGEETRVDVMDMDGSREGNAVLVRPGERLLIEPLIVGGAGS
jgi:predicted phosphodiesterase